MISVFDEFPLGIPVMEDLIFCVNALRKSEKVSVNQGFYYHYIFHSGSAVRSYCKDLNKVQLEVFSLLEDMLFNETIYEKAKRRLNMRYINMCISNIVNEVHRDNNKSIGKKYRNVKIFCMDSKLQDIIKSIDMKGYTLRKKTILVSIKYGFSLYVFLYYYLYGKLIDIRNNIEHNKGKNLWA